ncbi:MAG: inositol monophosphatase family protein, partial [Thermoanaerobaculia bacterium]|nr:inositol monophosphatase family protein [Thermoanaerobaculia bacterium]
MTQASRAASAIPDLDTVVELVRRVATEELLPRFGRTARRSKADGSPVTEADLAVQDRLAHALAELTPAIPLLAEETPLEEQAERLHAPALWCLDPLDGTTNFTAGVPFFCTSLALVRDGTTELGVVHDPWRDETFAALRGA